MDNIKFRSSHYDNVTNEFSHFSFWGKINHNGSFSNDCFISPSQSSSTKIVSNDIFICQVDKNGIQIFNGDILKRHKRYDNDIEFTGTVTYEGTCFSCYGSVEDGFDHDDILSYQNQLIEVIGNIHE